MWIKPQRLQWQTQQKPFVAVKDASARRMVTTRDLQTPVTQASVQVDSWCLHSLHSSQLGESEQSPAPRQRPCCGLTLWDVVAIAYTHYSISSTDHTTQHNYIQCESLRRLLKWHYAASHCTLSMWYLPKLFSFNPATHKTHRDVYTPA